MLLALFALASGMSGAYVTYSNPGARLERLLPELSRACRIKLTSSPELRNLVVVLRLQHASRMRVLDQIAYVVRGMWEAAPGGFNLVFDQSGIATELAAEAVRFHKQIHSLLAPPEWMRFTTTSGRPVDDTRRLINVREFADAWDNLSRAFDETKLWNLHPGHSLEFSTDPRPLQHAMPPDAAAMVPALFRAATNAIRLTQSPGSKPFGRPTKLTLTFTSYEGDSQTLAFSGSIIDSEGRIVVSPGDSVSEFHDPGPGLWDEVVGVQPTYLPVSEGFKELSRYVTSSGPCTTAVRKFITTPLSHDPLSLYGEELTAYARVRRQQLVACLTDSMDVPIDGDPDKILANRFQGRFSRDGMYPYPDWIHSRPELDEADLAERPTQSFGRSALQRFAAAVPAISGGTLADEAAAEHLGFSQFQDLPQAAMLTALGDYKSHCRSGISRFALLTDAQRSSLLVGGKVPLTETPKAFQDSLADILVPGQPVLHGMEDTMDVQPVVGTTKSDPTELADAAVPTAGYLTLTRSLSKGYEVKEAGDRLRRVSGEFFGPMPDRYFRVHRFRPGIRSLYVLRIYIVPGYFVKDTFSAYVFRPTTKWVKLSQLYETERKEIMGYVAKYRHR